MSSSYFLDIHPRGVRIRSFLDIGAEATMTSREIADLTENRHGTVKVPIERLAEQGLISFPSLTETPRRPWIAPLQSIASTNATPTSSWPNSPRSSRRVS